ncbi:hypothetical protein SAMN04489841_4522 [Natrinema salaciae]|uniref:Uncharacterized protein n=1 Tax=Natrinema salaciae TaxID=1186196 RepID=A0A1H9RZK6_9EURY|nr:hypothetical protein SAMN04489841_4522 [Natrinema salaciae]
MIQIVQVLGSVPEEPAVQTKLLYSWWMSMETPISSSKTVLKWNVFLS